MLTRWIVLLLCFSCCTARAQHALGIYLQRYDYPYPVYYHPSVVQHKDVKIAYMDVRPGKPNGKTVLLLHGKNFNAAYWEQTIRALNEAGFRVIAPDALGFGKSSKPIIQYSFSLLASLTKELLDEAGVGRVYVVGHSMGGMLATRFALTYPGRVEKLVLEDAIGLEDWRAKGVPYRKVDAWFADEQNATYESIRRYHQTSYYPQWEPKYGQWVDVQYGMKLSKHRKRLDWVNALTYDMIYNQPVCHEFKNISMPTLVVVGKEDHTRLARGASKAVAEKLGHYEQLGKQTADAIKNAELITYDHTGHIPHLEIPVRFHRDLINFLK